MGGKSVSPDTKKRLFKDKAAVRCALQQDWKTIDRMAIELWQDPLLVLEAVKGSYKAMDKVPKDSERLLWANQEIAYAVVSQNWEMIEKIEPCLQEGRELALS